MNTPIFRQIHLNLNPSLSKVSRIVTPSLYDILCIFQIIHKTRYGLVEERAGGLPMKLRIFLAPFQLIDEKNKKLYTLNESTLITKDLGNVF